jgi:hypothetical protein
MIERLARRQLLDHWRGQSLVFSQTKGRRKATVFRKRVERRGWSPGLAIAINGGHPSPLVSQTKGRREETLLLKGSSGADGHGGLAITIDGGHPSPVVHRRREEDKKLF